MPNQRVCALSLLALIYTGACATRATPYTGPAVTPAHQSLETWTEELPQGAGFRIMIRNNTHQAVRLTTIELYDCQNVNQVCARTQLGIRLAPGQTTEVLEVRPALPNYEFSFNYRFSTSGEP